MSIQSGNLVFYYMGRENLCFLTLCEESYPKRLAFLYLEEVADALVQEMIKDFGTNVSSIRKSCCVVTCVAHFVVALCSSDIAATAGVSSLRYATLHVRHPDFIFLRAFVVLLTCSLSRLIETLKKTYDS